MRKERKKKKRERTFFFAKMEERQRNKCYERLKESVFSDRIIAGNEMRGKHVKGKKGES